MSIPDWVPDTVMYQIFPDRFYNGDPRNDPPGTQPWGGAPTRDNFFGGDLEGIIKKLDYIADLGVNAIYLNPIFKAGSNHKYDTYDYFSIDASLGDDSTFDRLVKEAHDRGIRIILDGVFNHCGVGFPPFQDLLKNGASSRYKDWFIPYDLPIRMEPFPNYATCGGVAFLPKLNHHNPEVEAFIQQVALYWLSRGIDGWRLDVAYEIPPHFWRRFRKVIKKLYPNAYLVAEEWRDPSPLLQGDMFDGATHFELRRLLLDFFVADALCAESFARALENLRRRLPSRAEWGMLTFLENHDTPRIFTLCKRDVKLVILLYVFILTYPGVPLIYYGGENGMEGADDPDCRRPMVWDEREWNVELRETLKKLIWLRRNEEVLRRGRFEVGYVNDRIFTYYRRGKNKSIFIILNNTRVPRRIGIPVTFRDGVILKDALTGEYYQVAGRKLVFDPLAPRRAWVLIPEGRCA